MTYQSFNLRADLPKEINPPLSSRGAALVIGLDSHGLAVVRALADAGIPVYAIEKDPDLPGVATRRTIKTFNVQDFSDGILLPALLHIRMQLSEYPEVVLIAINDRHVEMIGRNIKQLGSKFNIAWSHCVATVLELQRKDALEARARRQGMLYPRSLIMSDESESDSASDFRFPLIIKPVRPLSSFKTLMARNLSELRRLLEECKKDAPILVQEYIEGNDQQIYFGALMLNHGDVIFGMVGRKIESFPPARGQTTVAETIDNPEVLLLTKHFFEGLSISGPVSLEVKRDEQGNYWIIEPTVGRTDFWVELCIHAGFNQPLMEYQLAMGQYIEPPTSIRESVWYDTERDPLAYARLCWHNKTLLPLGKSQTFPYFRVNAWRPFTRAVIKLLRTTLNLGLQKIRRGASG